MDRRTTPQVPGCEGWHAANVSRRRPGDLAGSQGPLGTTAYKAEPKSLLARQEVRGAHSTAYIALETGREGRSPASVSGARRSLGCPIASRLPTELTKSGNCREPYIAHPSRRRRKGFIASMTKSGEWMSSGRLGDRSRRTRGHLGWMAWRSSGLLTQGMKRR